MAIIGIISTIIFTIIFSKTGDPVPFFDSLITSASLIAEYMLCLKLYEAWAIYLASDLVSICLFFSQKLYVTTGTYVAFTFICVLGVMKWGKKLKCVEV
jgi:nicotinamide mononucleotide transporter